MGPGLRDWLVDEVTLPLYFVLDFGCVLFLYECVLYVCSRRYSP